MQFRCGHEVSVPKVGDVVREFVEGARLFDCPLCQQEWLISQGVSPSIYINLQKLSPGLVAYVVEVDGADGDFLDVLQMAGYVRSSLSIDESHPGRQSERGKILRKEYWFAEDTDPLHAVTLLNLLKQEISWLSGYLPRGTESVHYWDFPA